MDISSSAGSELFMILMPDFDSAHSAENFGLLAVISAQLDGLLQFFYYVFYSIFVNAEPPYAG